MSPSVQAIRRFLEAHDRFAAHNGITVEDADYDYGKVVSLLALLLYILLPTIFYRT